MTTKITETQSVPEYTKVPRTELVAACRERDGDICMHPDCGRELDFDVTEGPLEPTIDHWYSQSFGKQNGLTIEEIWAVSNLKLMHKKCNAKKGDLIPNEDGTLPPKPQSTFRFRRQKRAGRAELCVECDNGHNLSVGEVCANCGCDAQRFPRWAKVKYSDCDHDMFWCIWCSIGVVDRVPAIGGAMRQADSTELGEFLDDQE